jgi:hypothetical protein
MQSQPLRLPRADPGSVCLRTGSGSSSLGIYRSMQFLHKRHLDVDPSSAIFSQEMKLWRFFMAEKGIHKAICYWKLALQAISEF